VYRAQSCGVQVAGLEGSQAAASPCIMHCCDVVRVLLLLVVVVVVLLLPLTVCCCCCCCPLLSC
jgi:hypothetical protein